MQATNKMRKTIAIIYGGKSGEHEVSLQTAFAVIGAFQFDTYRIVPFFITKEGVFRAGEALDAPVQSVHELTLAKTEAESAQPLAQARISSIGQFLETCAREKVDVVFPLLHGTFGEDGTIQGLLELAHLPYIGAGVLASACGMDKVAMKRMFAQAGLAQCLYRSFMNYEWVHHYEHYITEIEVVLGYPCFVKPANLGSSVGIGKAHDREELMAAIENAFRFDNKVIVEEFIDGREVEVSVLGNEYPEASVPGEIISSNEFYDYHAKYIDGKSRMQIPAELSSEQAEEVRKLAIRAYQAIDGSGLSRVDFFLRRDNGAFYVNEINTMPGFTPFSMYPLMWKATGKPYAELLDQLIRLAEERHETRTAIAYTFASPEKERV